MDIKRKDAARLIDEIILLAANEIHGPGQPPAKWALDIARVVEKHGLKMPTKCKGEAHNPEVGGMIDRCGSCGNFHWELVGTDTKVK